MIAMLAQQVTMDEILPNKDPLYLIALWQNVLAAWTSALTHPEISLPILFLFGVLCGLITVRVSIKLNGWRFAWNSLTWAGALPGIRHIRKWLGERAMRKEILEAQSDQWVEEIVEIAESKVAADLWTRTQAKEWYAKFSRHLPILRYAAIYDDANGDLKEIIRERMRNEHRDANGAIVPAPLPQ
jgi:hypothetical protein